MRRYPLYILVVLASLILAACSPSAPQAGTPKPNIDTQPTNAGGMPEAVIKAQAELAARLGLRADEIQIGDFQPAQFPDSCLGAASANEMCAQVITPGFSGRLLAGGASYEFRTNTDGDIIRLLPGAVLSARQFLAQQLQVEVDRILLVNYAAAEWPDACLGIAQEGVVCAQVLTPGYMINLEYQGQVYELRSDENGGMVQLASGAQVDTGAYFINWQNERDGVCEAAEISMEGQSYGPCGVPGVIGKFISAERESQALYFFGTFSAFEASTPVGTLRFSGRGLEQATTSQQRMIAEWANLVAQEAASGRDGAAWGVALTWNRTGGLAGFCDNVVVYVTGEVVVESCKSSQQELARLRLTAEELEQLFGWVDSLAPFEDTYKDPAPVDALSLYLVFTGRGSGSPTVEQKEAMNQFASNLAAEASRRSTPGSEQDAAQLALVEFFLALSRKDYEAALDWYGGSFEVLRGYNPDMPANDLLALLQRGCEFNGHVCNLTVGNVLEVAPVDASTFQFTVQLMSPNGELFQQGPCCGEDPSSHPPTTRYTYTVLKVDGRYLVQDLPPYMP